MIRQLLVSFLLLASFAKTMDASTLTRTSTDLFVYLQSSPAHFNEASPEFTSSLDAENFGSYSWLIVNTTASTWNNFSVIAFVDAEWDLNTNLVSNEYAEFLNFGLPAGAPPGAFAFTSWEADEPGYVFGDIYTNASISGVLDNTNAVPSSAPDDVSIGLGWFITTSIGPGQSLKVTLVHTTAALVGIAQLDPDSNATLVLNGYYEILGDPVGAPPPGEVPEPATAAFVATGIVVFCFRSRKGSR